MKDDCCRCERLIADLRAEFEQLREPRKELMREVKEIAEAIGEKNSALLTKIEQQTFGLLADVDRSVQRLFDTLSERLLLPPQRTDEEPPPRPHWRMRSAIRSRPPTGVRRRSRNGGSLWRHGRASARRRRRVTSCR